MSRGRRFILMLSGLLALAALTVSCGEEQAETKPLIRPVRYQPVYATGGTRVRTFSGVAAAAVESNLSFKVAGSIDRLPVSVGDHVKAGQLIAQLDPSDYELQLDQAQASLDQARAEARNAASAYERVRGLYENDNASKNDLDQARTASESAAARVQSADKQKQLAELQLSYTRLTAPVEGDIARIDVEANENVRIGSVVAVITSGDRMEVEVGVPEILISQIREGQRVDVTFDAIPDKTFGATVTEVGVAATGMVTTFPVAVLLNRSQPDVRPGMAAEVAFEFHSADTRERFIVPSVAVHEDREGRFVFVVEPTEEGLGVAHRRTVTVGELVDAGLEVFDGLLEGDLLVTAGVSKIKDGQQVRLTGAQEITR